jgi:hypothetical protein
MATARGFNRRTNIKIINSHDEDKEFYHSSSLLSTNILQNVTINYSHQDLQIFKNNIEIAIRTKPKDPKVKIQKIFLKFQKQYLLLTVDNLREMVSNILQNESKIMMKV